MPTILAFGGGGGGGMKFISAGATSGEPTGYTDSKYKDGSGAWYNTDNNLLYFYTGGAWRAVNTYQ